MKHFLNQEPCHCWQWLWERGNISALGSDKPATVVAFKWMSLATATVSYTPVCRVSQHLEQLILLFQEGIHWNIQTTRLENVLALTNKPMNQWICQAILTFGVFAIVYFIYIYFSGQPDLLDYVCCQKSYNHWYKTENKIKVSITRNFIETHQIYIWSFALLLWNCVSVSYLAKDNTHIH